MSEQNPPGVPEGGPDPFDELLKGLREESTEPAPAPAEAAPEVSSVDQPTVAFTPVDQTAPLAPEEPTVAFAPQPEAANPVPEPVPPYVAPGLPPTVALPGTFEPTAATSVLGGAGGGVPPEEPPSGGGGFKDWDPRRRTLFIVLVSLAGVLLIALVVALIAFAVNGNQPNPDPTGTRTTSPTHSSTPTPTPSRSATPTPTPTPTAAPKPAVQSFAVTPTTAECSNGNAATKVTLHFSWNITGTTTDVVLAANGNAVKNGLRPAETDYLLEFGCDSAQVTYTITAVAPDGQRYSGTPATVNRKLPDPPAPPAAPTVSSFDASPATADCSASPSPIVTLTWNTTNATSVAISGVPGTFAASGSTTTTYDCAQEQITYTLTATGASGTSPATADDTVTRDSDDDGDDPGADD